MARDPQFWSDELRDADDRRSAFRRLSVKNRRRYANVDPHPEDGGQVRLNMLFADISNKRAMLQPEEVEVAMLATTEDQEDNARVSQAVVNSQFRDVDVVEEVAKVLQHALLDGVGFARVSWALPVTGGVKAGPDEGDADAADYNREATKKDRNDPIKDWLQKAFIRWGLDRESPILQALDPMDVLMDPTVTDLKAARWYAIRHWMPRRSIEEGMKVGFFQTKDLSGTIPSTLASSEDRWGEGVLATGNRTAGSQDPSMMSPDTSANPEEDIWEFWEIRDREEDKIHYLVVGQEFFLRTEPYKLGIHRPTIVDFKPDFLPQTYWTPAESSQYLHVQTDLNATINAVRDYIRRFSKTIVPVRRGQLTPEEITTLKNATEGSVVELTNPDALKALNMGTLSGDFLQYISMMQNFITVMSGVSPVAQGLPSNPGSSATEIATISRSFSIRMRRMQHSLNRFLANVAGLFLDFNQKLLPSSHVIALLGADAEYFSRGTLVIENRKKLEGEHHIKVAAGAAGDAEQELRKKQSLERYSIMINNPNIDTRKLTERTLRDFGDDPRSLMTPEGGQPDMGPGMGEEQQPGRGLSEQPAAVSPGMSSRVADPQLQAQLGSAQRGG